MKISRVLASLCALGAVSTATAQTGTFVDRTGNADVRIASYNIAGFATSSPNDNHLFERIFNGVNLTWVANPLMERLHNAIQPDVWMFQELVSASPTEIANEFNRFAPLPNGELWQAHRMDQQTIVSRYALTPVTGLVSGTPRDPALAVVDLPSSDQDLYLANIHLAAFFSGEPDRRSSADRLARHLIDATTPGGDFDLPENTPFVVGGDFNSIFLGGVDPDGNTPVNTLVTGDITDNASFGPDAPLDWDNTDLARARPTHNNTPNGAEWTFANGSQSILDLMLYTDSVMEIDQSFILNTRDMTPQELAATGLLVDDVVFELPERFDHLPVVVDFIVIPEPGSAFTLLSLGSLALLRRRR